MILKKILYYAILVIFYLNPFVTLSVKGIVGIIFIIISSTTTNLKGSIWTAIVLDILLALNFRFEINIDITGNSGFVNALIGSVVYLTAAIYLGRNAEKLKTRNKELQFEIEMRKSAEKELKENLSIDKLKTEFFSNISHELRTPLNVIFCAEQLLEMNLNRQEPIDRNFVKKNVMSIKQNSLRLLRLVNNLIDITKIDAQAIEIRLHNQDIVYVVREIVLSVSDYITNKGLKLLFHSDVREKTMAFDEEKLERILLNLLSNAIKFSPPGESIHVDIFEKEGSVCIRVMDKGIGIPPDRCKDIFQRFYQISPMHTRLREGSGIGLNLVKSLVEMHQGVITVDSVYGKGTSFLIELPVRLVPEDMAEKEEYKDRQVRIESIQLEFSDIYLSGEPKNRAAAG